MDSNLDLSVDEAVSILTTAAQSDDGDLTGLSFTLARATKEERLSHIKNVDESIEKLISAQIEIARAFRGYKCRKTITSIFVSHDESIRQKEDIIPNDSLQISDISTHSIENVIQGENAEDTEGQIIIKDAIKEDKVPGSAPPNTADNSVTKESLPSRKGGKTEQSTPTRRRRAAAVPSRPPRKITSKTEAAIIIQKAWRRHIDMQVFRYYRDLIHFRGQGDPALLLKCINPKEASLLDAAAGIHVRFRLAGEKFPPNIYYKIYTHRPIVDMCANSPKDYTKPSSKYAVGKQVHNKHISMNLDDRKEGWYERIENNGWRLVSDRLIYASMDPVTRATSHKKVEFHHVKLQRKIDVEKRRRKRKIDWMRKMYKEGMLAAKDADLETTELVEKAARGLVNTVSVQGPDAVMDWEVDELLQWTTALNFDDYLEVWKETATSNISELEATQIKNKGKPDTQDSVKLDSFRLTRDSSTALRHIESAAAQTNTTAEVDGDREWTGNDVKATRELKSVLQSASA